MMKHVNPSEEQEKLDFIAEAAKAFAEHPEYKTWTPPAKGKGANIEPGAYLAVRWGLDDDCVLLLLLDPDFEPTIYAQAIPKQAEYLSVKDA